MPGVITIDTVPVYNMTPEFSFQYLKYNLSRFSSKTSLKHFISVVLTQKPVEGLRYSMKLTN